MSQANILLFTPLNLLINISKFTVATGHFTDSDYK